MTEIERLHAESKPLSTRPRRSPLKADAIAAKTGRLRDRGAATAASHSMRTQSRQTTPLASQMSGILRGQSATSLPLMDSRSA